MKWCYFLLFHVFMWLCLIPFLITDGLSFVFSDAPFDAKIFSLFSRGIILFATPIGKYIYGIMIALATFSTYLSDKWVDECVNHYRDYNSLGPVEKIHVKMVRKQEEKAKKILKDFDYTEKQKKQTAVEGKERWLSGESTENHIRRCDIPDQVYVPKTTFFRRTEEEVIDDDYGNYFDITKT